MKTEASLPFLPLALVGCAQFWLIPLYLSALFSQILSGVALIGCSLPYPVGRTFCTTPYTNERIGDIGFGVLSLFVCYVLPSLVFAIASRRYFVGVCMYLMKGFQTPAESTFCPAEKALVDLQVHQIGLEELHRRARGAEPSCRISIDPPPPCVPPPIDCGDDPIMSPSCRIKRSERVGHNRSMRCGVALRVNPLDGADPPGVPAIQDIDSLKGYGGLPKDEPVSTVLWALGCWVWALGWFPAVLGLDMVMFPLTIYPMPKLRAIALLRVIVYGLVGSVPSLVLQIYSFIIFAVQVVKPDLIGRIVPSLLSSNPDIVFLSFISNIIFSVFLLLYVKALIVIFDVDNVWDITRICEAMSIGTIGKPHRDSVVYARGACDLHLPIGNMKKSAWIELAERIQFNKNIRHIWIRQPAAGLFGGAPEVSPNVQDIEPLARTLGKCHHLLSINSFRLTELRGDIVEELDLSSSWIPSDPIAFPIISFFTAKSKRLESMDLSGCKIDLNSAVSVGFLLCHSTSLRWLKMHNCSIGDTALELICDGLRQNIRLIGLGLKGNKFGVDGSVALAQAISTHPTLRSVDIGGNSLGEAGRHALKMAFDANPSVKHSSIS